MTCPICQHEGHDDQTDLCRTVRAASGNRAGVTRRTLQGMAAAIQLTIQRMVNDGAVGPFVFLYVRPGALPSVKVTVELHKPVNDTQVIMEEHE